MFKREMEGEQGMVRLFVCLFDAISQSDWLVTMILPVVYLFPPHFVTSGRVCSFDPPILSHFSILNVQRDEGAGPSSKPRR